MNANLALGYLGAVGLLFGAGCHHAVKPVRPVEGSSMFSFVERPVIASTGPTAQVVKMVREPVDVLRPAEPIEPLATPRYPRAALGRVGLPVTVGVRINVDATGRVAHVGASLVAFSSGGEFAEEFRAAVEQALARWRFNPAEIQHLVPGAADPRREDHWLITHKAPTDYAFDLSFTFTSNGEVIPEKWR